MTIRIFYLTFLKHTVVKNIAFGFFLTQQKSIIWKKKNLGMIDRLIWASNQHKFVFVNLNFFINNLFFFFQNILLADPSCKPHETNKFNILDLSFYITTFTLLLWKFWTNSPSKTYLCTVLSIGPLLLEEKNLMQWELGWN